MIWDKDKEGRLFSISVYIEFSEAKRKEQCFSAHSYTLLFATGRKQNGKYIFLSRLNIRRVFCS
jgi:hypothetical protein